MKADVHTLTVRLPERLYGRAAATARRRGLSVNAYLVQQIESGVQQDLEQQLFEEAGMIGDLDDCDVSYAFEAQAEVVLRDGG